MAVITINDGTYAEMLAEAEAIAEPKQVEWLLDHFIIRTGDDLESDLPQDEIQ